MSQMSQQVVFERPAGETVKPEQPRKQEDCCSICLEELTIVGLATLRCGHKLHLTCYTTLISMPVGRRCPLCRDVIQHNRNRNPHTHTRTHTHRLSAFEIATNMYIRRYAGSRNLCMKEIITAMGRNNQQLMTAEKISHMIEIIRLDFLQNARSRSSTRANLSRRPYALQSIINNLNRLINTGEVVKIGNNYLRLH